MNQRNRILLVIALLPLLVGGILTVDALQRRRLGSTSLEDRPPGSIPIFIDGDYIASFTPDDLVNMELASFVDQEEGKIQEGWLLKDVLDIHLDVDSLSPSTVVIVSSTSRDKGQTLSWVEVSDIRNMVMFDLSGRGTLKLVSKIDGFDIRDAWIQDVDKIELKTP